MKENNALRVKGGRETHTKGVEVNEEREGGKKREEGKEGGKGKLR